MKTVTVNGKTMIDRPIACAVLAYSVKEDRIIMVRQDRGTFGTILEVPAGKVDVGEKPEDCAKRELLEETGYKAETVIPLLDYYPSVGYSTEKINCYYTDTITDTGKQRLDDNERVEIVKIKMTVLIDKIRHGEVKDSKAMMCILALMSGMVLPAEEHINKGESEKQ